MFTLLAIAIAAVLVTIYLVLAPYVRFFVRILPRMLFENLTEADKRGIIVQLQALNRQPLF
ncbi:hypothetical protein [Erythrobacter aureus]|uniref:Uncharacterized protein n=1 Tax=Erythrobacter aureus TaxID=2182384 RepID=A0A345YIU3_9SPHN|nr:hypothetical protein [Erythrobacter aureus]AXK43845.1 hypothetical protein DVR09_15435 [Erythrobacter aureus]